MPGLPDHPVRASAVVLLAVLAGCVNAPPPNVGLKPFTADLVFGIPPLDQPVALPNTLPGPLPFAFDDFPIKKAIPPPPVETEECPSALLNVVEESADISVKGRPQEGTYRWKHTGYFKAGDFGRIQLDGLHQRGIQDVERLASNPKDFQYTMVQEEQLGGRVFESTFEVITSRPNPPPVSNQTYYETTSKSGINGIFLTRLSGRTPDGGEFTSTLEPAVLYLPLPVPVGVTFTTTSSDPTTFVTIEHEGSVRERRRYDACGELVEGWFVDARQAVTFPDPENRACPDQEEGVCTIPLNYDYSIATQFGGLMIFEHIEVRCEKYDSAKQACVPDPDFLFDTNIGQLEP